MHCRMIMREKEIFYKSKFSLTPKRKVASYVGRLCEEGKEIFYKSKLSLTPKRKVASYVGRLCEEGNTGLTWQAFLQMKSGDLFG